MTRRNALITGAGGQDGWYLSHILGERGDRVFGLVQPGDDSALPDFVYRLVGDMRSPESLAAALDVSEADDVYNLAALSSVGDSWSTAKAVAEVNAVALIGLLDEIASFELTRHKSVHLVQASSAEIFGASKVPHTEDTVLSPRNPYAASKAYAHSIVAIYRERGLHASNAILYSHESPRRPLKFVTRKITHTVAEIAAGQASRLSLGNVDVIRDWGFAGDHMLAVARMSDQEVPNDYIVSTGVGHSLADFVRSAFESADISDWESYVDVVATLGRPTDVAEQVGDFSRARRVLDWSPSIPFEALVEDMVKADMAAIRGRAQ